MKQLLLSTFLIVGVIFSLHAQDKIVTLKNDTILCKIIKSNQRFISFQMNQNGIQTSGKLDRQQVKQLILSDDSLQHPNSVTSYNRLQLSVSGGLGFLVGNTKKGKEAAMKMGLTQEQADDYYQQLIFGWKAGANAHYFLIPDFAVGLNYRFFTSDADLWVNMDPQDGLHLYYGRMVENMYVNYLGASVLSRQALTRNHKIYLTSAISAGLTTYRDEATIITSSYLLTGKALGLTFDMGMEYYLAKNISVGVNLNLFASKIKKVTLDDGYNSTTAKLDKENQENISSLDLSTGLKIYF